MARDPWIDDVYSRYDYFFIKSYVRRRKQVDNIRLDWLDIEELYRSPAVVLFSKEEILEVVCRSEISNDRGCKKTGS